MDEEHGQKKQLDSSLPEKQEALPELQYVN
jgi:hypothetical protein